MSLSTLVGGFDTDDQENKDDERKRKRRSLDTSEEELVTSPVTATNTTYVRATTNTNDTLNTTMSMSTYVNTTTVPPILKEPENDNNKKLNASERAKANQKAAKAFVNVTDKVIRSKISVTASLTCLVIYQLSSMFR